MLEAIRKRSGSIVVKIMLVFLVISFGAWGIGDYVTGGAGANVVAKVGDREIDIYAFDREYRREYVRIRQLFGDGLTPDAARALGLQDNVINRMVRTELLAGAADRAGLLVGDAEVAKAIQTMEQFRGLTGQFDRQAFAEAINRAGFSEAAFVEMVRGEIARETFADGVIGTPALPRVLSDRLYRHRAEARDAEVALIPDAALLSDYRPDVAEIAAYFADNQDRFQAPAYRTVVFVTLGPDAVSAEVSVSEQDVADAYDQRAAQFATASRRNLAQMILTDAASAANAVASLHAGDGFSDVAARIAGADGDDLELGWVTRDDLFAEVADAVFSAGAGEIVGPLESPLGWHVFLVNEAEDAAMVPLDGVRDELVDEIVRERALDLLFDLANQFDELLGSGASLEDAARQLNLTVERIPNIDRSGRGADGETVAGLPGDGFAATVFAEEVGLESTLIETADGYYALRVEEETEPRPRTLDEVESQVVDELARNDRVERARRLAEAIVEQVDRGASLADAVADVGATVSQWSGVTRRGDNVPEDGVRSILAPLFAVDQGRGALAPAGDSYVVARVTRVVTPDPAAGAEALSALRQETAEALRADLTGQLVDSLLAGVDVEINRAALDRQAF